MERASPPPAPGPVRSRLRAHHYNSPAHGPARILPLRPAARCRETRAARGVGAGETLGVGARSDAGIPARARRRGGRRFAFQAADAAPARAVAYDGARSF